MTKKETTEKKPKSQTKSKTKKNENIDVEKVIESLEKIDTNIVVEDETITDDKMNEEISQISKLAEEIKNIETSQKEFSEKLQASPENAKKIIEDEIAKVTELKKKTEEKINNTPNRKDVTSWWNGIGFSM